MSAVANAIDPVVTLCRQYADLTEQQDRYAGPGAVLRAMLEAGLGRPTCGVPAKELWGKDHRYPELLRLNEGSNELADPLGEVCNKLEATPPRTLAGLLAKIRFAISLWPRRADFFTDSECHEQFTLATLIQATCLLETLVERA